MLVVFYQIIAAVNHENHHLGQLINRVQNESKNTKAVDTLAIKVIFRRSKHLMVFLYKLKIHPSQENLAIINSMSLNEKESTLDQVPLTYVMHHSLHKSRLANSMLTPNSVNPATMRGKQLVDNLVHFFLSSNQFDILSSNTIFMLSIFSLGINTSTTHYLAKR